MYINEPYFRFRTVAFQSAVRRGEFLNLYVHFGTLPRLARAA